MKNFLVTIRENFSDIVTPERNIFEVNGQKRFWFFYDGKKRLAAQKKNGTWATI